MKQLYRTLRERAIASLYDQLFKSRSLRRLALRKLFSDYMPPSALAFISFSDHSFYVDPRDHMIAFQLLSGQGWQRQTFDQAINLTKETGALRNNGWFIDVGANIGTQTVYAMKSGLFCGALAIEPDPHNFDLLKRNISVNALSDCVRAVQIAASGRKGTAILSIDEKNFGAHAIVGKRIDGSGQSIQVDTQTVDAILAQNNIQPTDVALAWIDVEAHEIEVLRGMSKLRECNVPIVSEVAGLHSEQQHAALKAMLAKDYDVIFELPDESNGLSHGKEMGQYDFRAKHSDLLFLKRGAVVIPATRS